MSYKKAIFIDNNTITNVILVNMDDDPTIYGATELALDNQDAEVGWILKGTRWIDPNPFVPIHLEPDLTPEQIVAALLA